MKPTLFGIPNCDTVKKARDWLQRHNIEFAFHDFKKQGIDRKRLQAWSQKIEWQSLLNRKGMTWRKLSISNADNITKAQAFALMCEHSSIIKRPVLVKGAKVWVGFDPTLYQCIFISTKK